MKLTYDDGINTFVGKSDEVKPLGFQDVPDPVAFFEMDTGDIYFYDPDTDSWILSGG